jgi:hypothetical protein
MRFQGETLRHNPREANPNKLGSFVPFVTGVCLTDGVDAATRPVSGAARAAEQVGSRLRVDAT